MRTSAVLVTVCIAIAVVLGACKASTTRPPDRVRKRHFHIGGGGFNALTGPKWGPSGTVEYYPAGSFGRLGVRGDVRGFEGVEEGAVTAGVVFEAAAARPRLQLSLHADIGFTFGTVRPVIGLGIQSQLWLIGPLALAIDGGPVLLYDGVDTVLMLAQSLQLRLAW